jgi:hypothetical protein
VRIVLLVGAGATVQPPLGDQLFIRLVHSYPDTWGNLPESVVTEFQVANAGFERGMAALREEGVHTQAALIDMSIYFAGFRIPPHGVNRYFALVRMLDKLSPAEVEYTFGSLNYEILLEQSLSMAGHSAVYWGAPSSSVPRPVRVIKPHGSANFAVDTGTNTFEGTTFVGGGAYISGAPLKVVDIDEVHQASVTGFPSAMSLYAPGKPDLVCPEFVHRFRDDWAEAVDGSDVVIVIGARPVLDSDPHIWQPIIDSPAELVLIGGGDDAFQRLVGPRQYG